MDGIAKGRSIYQEHAIMLNFVCRQQNWFRNVHLAQPCIQAPHKEVILLYGTVENVREGKGVRLEIGRELDRKCKI